MYRSVHPNFLQKNWQTNFNGHVETNEEVALQYQVPKQFSKSFKKSSEKPSRCQLMF